MDLCLVSYVKEAPVNKCDQNAGDQSYCNPKLLQGTQGVWNELAAEKKSKSPSKLCPVEKEKKTKKCKKKKKAHQRKKKNDPCLEGSSTFDPYETTFMRDFTYRPGSAAEPMRPKSTNGYTYPYKLHEPIGGSSYTDDYAWKLLASQHHRPCRKPEPHPCDVLWLWKQLKKSPETFPRVNAYFSHPMSAEDICRVKSHQYDTIYRQDYLGLQQEYKLKCPPCVPIHREGEPCPPRTINQYHVPQWKQQPELAICTSRYGSNKQWDTAARGIVPRMTHAHMKNQEKSKKQTTYDDEYGNPGVHFTNIIKSLQPKEVKKYLESLPRKERDLLLHLLNDLTRK